MGDDQIVISSGQVVTPETVMSRSFTSAFRGYHPAEVRQFLKRVSDEMAASAGREVELRCALQDALARAAHPELDEATVTNVLGEHAARLIASARDTAASIAAEAEALADARLRDADLRITRVRQEADELMARRVDEAEGAVAAIQHAAEAEADALIDDAKRQGKDMVGEARALRERMLGDLTRRRRLAQLQVEQLRAARERLLAAYDVVRRTVQEATAELEASEPEARMAAEDIARRAETPQIASRPEARPELGPPGEPHPGEPEPSMSLVATPVAPIVREQRDVPVPASALFRRVQESAPLPPGRPPLRPQTVADAVAGRMPAPALSLAPQPPPVTAAPAFVPPAPAPSELATMEVPVVTPDAPSGGVDALFARIRADRAPADPEPSRLSPTSESPPALDHVADESAREGRDDLLENVEAGLARALKRVLQDEQNEVLDGLRRLGAPTGHALLPDIDAQMASYRGAALPWLQQAARAGIGFVSDPSPGSEAESDYPSLDARADTLARDLVEPLRERLSRVLDRGADADDPSVAAESLRATYRQWKVQQVEDCARHHAVTAFSVGAFAATPEGAARQWLVAEAGHCPDCDDNALAGPTVKGQPFPTGQLHPPAHPGCRCMLVPATA